MCFATWCKSYERMIFFNSNMYLLSLANKSYYWKWTGPARGRKVWNIPWSELCIQEVEEWNYCDRFWRAKSLPSAQFCAQRVLLNKLPTYDKLYQKRVHLNNTRCTMCENYDDTSNYLFFICEITSKIWKMIDLWIEVQFVHHHKAKVHFLGFDLIYMSTKCNIVWRTM